MESSLSVENIKNHFINNPEWERVFKARHKDWDKTDVYVERAKKIFEDNGFRFNPVHPYKGRLATVVELEVYNGDEWMFDQQGDQSQVLEQTLIGLICDMEDIKLATFKTFK